MISLNCVSNYCKEDISLIENYNEAINSNISLNISKTLLKVIICDTLYYV